MPEREQEPRAGTLEALRTVIRGPEKGLHADRQRELILILKHPSALQRKEAGDPGEAAAGSQRAGEGGS